MAKEIPHRIITFRVALFSLLSLQLYSAEQETQGIKVPTYPYPTMTTEQLHQNQASSVPKDLKSIQKRRIKPFFKRPRRTKINPSCLKSRACWPEQEAQTTRGSSHHFTVGLNFTGATANDMPLSDITPPDSMGAVGPKQFIIAINNGLRSFDKETGQPDTILEISLEAFFQQPGVTDPRIRYDHFSDRWFITALTLTSPVNSILIAASDSGIITPSTKWNTFAFRQDLISPEGDTGLTADLDTLGIDVHALYIGVNEFNVASGQFVNSTAFVVQKSSLLLGSPIITAFRGLINSTGIGAIDPYGVDNFDRDPQFGYFIGNDAFVFGQLDLYRVSNPGSTTPTISGPIPIAIPLDSISFTVPHKGNLYPQIGLLQGGIGATAPHIRNGQLFLTQDISVNRFGVVTDPFNQFPDPNPATGQDRDACRFFQFNLSAESTESEITVPTLVQFGTLFDPADTLTPRFFWMSTCMTTRNLDLVLGCSVASANEFANSTFAARRSTDTLGTLSDPILLTNSQAAYNGFIDFNFHAERWGDFSYTAFDSSNDSIWTVQEYTASSNNYGVQVTQLFAPAP